MVVVVVVVCWKGGEVVVGVVCGYECVLCMNGVGGGWKDERPSDGRSA